jgi:hypothetical protein
MTNPLQKYFRQPKIYIKLPSSGMYSQPGTIQGDPANIPVYGMTGMDEIIVRTPDALLSGESTAQLIASCCPAIKNPWDLSVLDIVLILCGIRIATYGNMMSIEHKCTNCASDNEYDIDLSKVIEFYMTATYQNSLTINGLVIRIQPLTYRQSTDINIRNFQLQQRISQTDALEDADQRQATINELFKELGNIQNELFKYAIESIDTGDQTVTERRFINEWIENCEKTVFDAVKEVNARNTTAYTMPSFPVRCDNCGTEVDLTVDLDSASFFVQA